MGCDFNLWLYSFLIHVFVVKVEFYLQLSEFMSLKDTVVSQSGQGATRKGPMTWSGGRDRDTVQRDLAVGQEERWGGSRPAL